MKITVSFEVDEAKILAESGQENLEDAVRQELGWLRDSGMHVNSLSFGPQQQPLLSAPQVSILCEEVEGDDSIRDFYVCGVSTDKDSLRKLMEAKIEEDEYGIIAENGVDEHDADHFLTNFSDGFVEYYILDKPVLSREEMLRVAAGELNPNSIHREPVTDGITLDKNKVAKLLGNYIEELECQDTMHAEIVNLIMGIFSREELEKLGCGEFIEDCLMTEEDRAQAQTAVKSSLDTQISNANAILQKNEQTLSISDRETLGQGRE